MERQQEHKESLGSESEQYRQLFECNPHPMWIFDFETLAFLAVNDAAIYQYGFTREEFLRMTIRDIRPPDDIARLMADIEQDHKGHDVAGVWRHRKKDGTVFEVEIVSHELTWFGRPAKLALAMDVTERRRAERALREAEERFRTVADFTYDWEYWAGPDGKMLYVSPSCESLTGFTPDQFMQNPELVIKIVHPDDLAAMRSHFKESFDTEERNREPSSIIDFRIVTRTGSIRWMNHTCRPVYGSDGKWLGRRVSNRDITGRKEFEDRIQRLSRLYATLSQVNQTIVRVQDRDSLFQSICQVVIEFGKLPMVWIGLLGSEAGQLQRAAFKVIEPDDPQKVTVADDDMLFSLEPLAPALRHGETVVYDNIRGTVGLKQWTEAALRHGYQAAAIVPIRCRGKVVGALNLYSSVPGYFSDTEERALLEETGMDISFALDTIEAETERKRAREEQTKLEEQLRLAQRMESIGRLAGGIAHDFNNLLGVIIGYSEVALLDLPGDDPLRETLQEIKKAGGRAAELTHQLLAFSRQQVIEPKVFDLNAAISDLNRMLERMIGEDIRLVKFLARDLGRIKADRGQLEQVIMNLVVNARDAMPSGGKVTIETANVELDDAYAREHFPVVPGKYVMLAIADSGIGMDAETQRHIFEPFFTTKELGKGTGLGLSTVYGIVKQSGGYIWVYSELNKGTTFKVYLPRVDEEVEIASNVKAERSIEGNETILLVEDADGIRRLTQQCLESKGYTILAVSDGPEAVQLAKQHSTPIDLLLTDVVLPSLGGPELAKQLTVVHPETRILYMSGYTDDAIVHHGVLEPGIAFLQKPFSVDDLWNKVRSVLDTH